MTSLEDIFKSIDSSDDDQLINLIDFNEEEHKTMSTSDYVDALDKRLLEFLDGYGWDNVKQLAREKYPSIYLYLLEISDREEDIQDIKDLFLNRENYEVDALDLTVLLGKIDDLDFLEQLATTKKFNKFIKADVISKIFNMDPVRAKEILKNIKSPCAITIYERTYEKLDDPELITFLLDNSKNFALGSDKENNLLERLCICDLEKAKEYLAEIIDNPLKHCLIKPNINKYLQSVINHIAKADKNYAKELAAQILDRYESYNVKFENSYAFTQHIEDPEKIKEYLDKYRVLNLDSMALKDLLNKLSEIDKAEAVNYSRKIIATLDKKEVGMRITCITACKDSEFIKECIGNRRKYYLDSDQISTLLAATNDIEFIKNYIAGANIYPPILYSILSATNNEQLYLHCVKNSEALNVNSYKIYQIMADKLPIESAMKLLKSADVNNLGLAFKEIFLNKIIQKNDPNTAGFIKKYIKNYKANRFDEAALVRVLYKSLDPELIDLYFDVKQGPIVEQELKLLLYSKKEDRRNQVLDLIFSGKVPLNEDTRRVAIFTAYTIKDEKTRKATLDKLKVERKDLKSRVCIPPDMTVGIEIESVGPLSKQIKDLKSLFILDGWDVKHDGSLADDEKCSAGVEITSPILKGDDPEINNKIAYISNFLLDEGQYANDTCGGHVHIGADYFKDYESYQNLVDLWINCEQIIYIISNQIGEVPRKKISDYAKPISKSYERIAEQGFIDFSDVENLKEIESQLNLASKRCNGINFNNLADYNKHTIEFRIPNGTVNPDTWIENINLFGNMLKKCQEITEIRKKDKDALSQEEKTQLKAFNALVFGNLDIDDRANLFVEFVMPENQQKTFHHRYFVNSKLLNLHSDVKEFLANETFSEPVDLMDLKETLFKQEGRITGMEYAICSTVLAQELQRMRGLNHEFGQ